MSASRPTLSAVEILQEDADRFTAYAREVLARYPTAPPRLMEAIAYSLLAGGKRLRPALVLETFHACANSGTGHPIENRKSKIENPSALATAVAMELIHTFSLVHDDLPAMDNDDLRRGRPTNHKVFGEAMGILAGDAMVAMAFELIAVDAAPELAARLIAELASATGPEGMIGGQVLDMEGERKLLTLEQLQQLHRKKTGALLTAACRLGAIAAGASESVLATVTEFGQHLGLAFQIVDDVLDVTSTPEQLGKATNKDAEKGKNTYPALIGLEASRQEALKQLAAALAALEPLGKAAESLRILARFVVSREV